MLPNEVFPMLVLLFLAACGTNTGTPSPYLEDGVRQATGEVAVEDTAATDSGDSGSASDSGTADAAAPVILDASGEVITSTDGSQQYYRFTIQFEDAQGDIDGGKVIYDFIASSGTSTELVTIRQSAEPEPGSVAGLTDQTITVVHGPIATGTYIVDAIVVRDTAGHASNQTALEFEVTAAAR
jgi:hypothetical protein